MLKSILAVAFIGVLAAPALADDEAERLAHWAELKAAVFDDRPTVDGAGLIALDAPKRALDAALVPITVTTQPGARWTRRSARWTRRWCRSPSPPSPAPTSPASRW